MAKETGKSGDTLEDDFYLSEEELKGTDSDLGDEGEIDDELNASLPTAHKSQRAAQLSETNSIPKKKRKKTRVVNEIDLSQATPNTLADYTNLAIKDKFNKLSQLELDAFNYESKHFFDNSKFDDAHTINTIDSFIKAIIKPSEVLQTDKSLGLPKLMVVTGAANRATDLVRAVKSIDTKLSVFKGFAKHMKLTEQQKFLESKKIDAIVGTPSRILELIEKEAISLKDLKLVVYDLQPDLKSRNLFTSNDNSLPALNLLKDQLRPFILKGTILAYF